MGAKPWPHITFDSAAGAATCTACGSTTTHGLRLGPRLVDSVEVFASTEAQALADFTLDFVAAHGSCS